jgi:predicted signal transduction protein with EAL and GGDEF domain
MRAPSEAIAEGVESQTQRQMLLQMGCRKAQGYLFARPMVLAEFMHFLGPASRLSKNALGRLPLPALRAGDAQQSAGRRCLVSWRK